MGRPLTYRPDIDGLRAIAVLAVLFYHAGLGISGGFVGVDVFFVISGYLITGLIVKEFENGQFYIINFWERRVRRILPALSVVVVSCVVAGWLLLLPSDYKRLGESVLAQAMLSSNIYFWTHTGYFDEPAETMPLLHTWSLAVEEQFYLFFPFLLIALKGVSRHVRVSVALVLCVISFGACVYFSYIKPSANFYLLPTRAWELLIGAVPALLVTRSQSRRWLRELVSWAGLLAILYAIIYYDRTTRFPGTAAILPCLGTGLVIWASTTAMTSVGKLLALPPLVFIGLISYSLYLWHWPMLVFAKYWAIAPISEALRLMILAASMVLAALTWRYIETPFRKRTIFKRQVQIFAFLGSVTAILLLLGILVRQLHGFPNRFSPQAVQYAAGSNDQGIRTALGLSEALNGQFIELGSGDKHLPVKLFVWGDSHAMATLSLLNVLCEEHSVRGLAATRAGNAPLLGFKSQVVWRGIKTVQEDSIPYNDAVLAYIRKNHISNVVLAAKWAGYNYDSNTDADIARLHRCLIDTLNGLNEAGAKTWILGQVPSPGLNVPRVLSSAVIFGCKDPEGPFFPLTAYFKDRRIQDQIFDGISAYGATVLDPAKSFLNPENRLVVADGGKSLYFDDNHLSVAGAMKLRPLFEPIFESMVEKPVAVGR